MPKKKNHLRLVKQFEADLYFKQDVERISRKRAERLRKKELKNKRKVARGMKKAA